MKLLLAVFSILYFAAADVGTGYNYVPPAVSVQTHHAPTPVKHVKHTEVSVSANVPVAPVNHHHTVAHKPALVQHVVQQQPTHEYLPPAHHAPAHVPAPDKVHHAPAPVKHVKHTAVSVSANVPVAPVHHHHTVAHEPALVQHVVPQQPTYEYVPQVHYVSAPAPVKVHHAPAPVKHVKHTVVSVSANALVAPVDHHHTVAHKPALVSHVVHQQPTHEYLPPAHHAPAHVPAPVKVHHAPAPVKHVKHTAVSVSANVPVAPVHHHHTVAHEPALVQHVVPQQPTYEYVPQVHHVSAPAPVKVHHAPAPVKHVKHTVVSVSANVPVAPVHHHHTVAHEPALVQHVVPQQPTYEYVPPAHHAPAHVPAPVKVHHAPAPVKHVKHTAVSVSAKVPVAPVNHHHTVAHKPALVQHVVQQQPTHEYLPPAHHAPAHVPAPVKVHHAPAPVKHVKHTAVSVSANVPVAPIDHHHTVVYNPAPVPQLVPQQPTYEYVSQVHHVSAPAPVKVHHAPAPVKHVKQTVVSVSANALVAPVDHHHTVAHKPALVSHVVHQQPTHEYLPPAHHAPAHVPAPVKVHHAPAPVKHVKHTAVSVSANVPVAPVHHHHTVAHEPALVQHVVPQQPTYEYVPPAHHAPAHVPAPVKVHHAPAPVKHVKHTAVSVSANVPVAPVNYHHSVVSNALPVYPVVAEPVVPGHELTHNGYLYRSPV